jgi:hypothetical protein
VARTVDYEVVAKLISGPGWLIHYFKYKELNFIFISAFAVQIPRWRGYVIPAIPA